MIKKMYPEMLQNKEKKSHSLKEMTVEIKDKHNPKKAHEIHQEPHQRLKVLQVNLLRVMMFL